METEGFEEKMKMLSDTLQNIVDNMNEKLNNFKKEYSKALNEIQELKKEAKKIKDQMKDVKSLEWESRNRNIVIFGLKGDINESKLDTYNRVMDLFSVKFKEHQIDNLYWIGKRKINRPLLIRFANSMIKEYILERKSWFKGCKLRVEDDYNEEVCNTRKQLVEYMFEARRRGEHAVLIRDKVLISGFQYDLEACRKNFKRGEEDTKERVKERTRTSEEGKNEVENAMTDEMI